MRQLVLIRGGGDLASGVALRLFRAGFRVLITELAQPLVIRRTVSFAEAIYSGETNVEGVPARHVAGLYEIKAALREGVIPVVVDQDCLILDHFNDEGHSQWISVLVDARMTKRPPDLDMDAASLVIGLGPGFIAGENCHAVIETNRSHFLGRVIWEGAALPDTRVPEGFGTEYHNRVLRAPADGIFISSRSIGDRVDQGELIAEVDGHQIYAPFKGVLRGLLHPGLSVQAGNKVGDIDPRDDPRFCRSVSDKALAVAGGVLEAILVHKYQHPELWG